MYPYGIVGNCHTSALIRHDGSIEWLCWPRPDSPPIFGKLLDAEGGEFSIIPKEPKSFNQHYVTNTNILVTEVTTGSGSYRITDFCPRFEQYGRMYRPNAVFRILEPIEGSPTVTVRCNPVAGWEKTSLHPSQGNSHVRYETRGDALRVLTSMPLTHFIDGQPFALREKTYIAITWSFALEDDLQRVTEDFLSRTRQYWYTWVKHCSIPSQFQKETIRSALTLKLHAYEDTGAILAAMTTSLPEEIGGVRNWDYRFCWLRDAYFALTAFHNLGHFEEMEGFLKFLLEIAYQKEDLQPVYRIDKTLPLPEESHDAWAGYEGSRPVRTNNEAATHVQNDCYGEMVLTLSPIFFDERFRHLRSRDEEKLLIHLATKCAQTISLPDAGLWELRIGWRENSFTNLMCWAGLERARRLTAQGLLPDSLGNLLEQERRAELAVRSATIDGSVRNGPTDPAFNAAMLQMPILRFPDPELNRRTVEMTARHLSWPRGAEPTFLLRYHTSDDFGVPQSAFLCCSFWWVQALAALGDKSRAAELLQRTLASANSLGLLPEHFEPATLKQLGNFPQAYSHVGLINGAFSVSAPWSEVL
jgi:GH15 family glucan-1,4-alpha-glucosidase